MRSPKFQGTLRYCLILLAAGLFLFGAAQHTGAAASAQEQPSKPPSRPPRTMQPPAQTQEPEEDRPQGQAAISVAVDLVTLQVLVTDPKGNVITGSRSRTSLPWTPTSPL